MTTALRRLGRWPAVAVAIVRSQAPLPLAMRDAAPNLVLAEIFGPGEVPRPAPWAHALVCEDTDAGELATRAAASPLPVIAMRRCGRPDGVVAS